MRHDLESDGCNPVDDILANAPDVDTQRRSILKSALAFGGTALAGGALAGGMGNPVAAATPAGEQRRQITGDRIVMLGTSGGPVPYEGLCKPSIALVVNDATYLVDCGMQSAQQVVEAGLGLDSIANVFVTHHHFDHTSGLPTVALHSWIAQPPRGSLAVWGPPDTGAKVEGILTAFAQDISLFETFAYPMPSVDPHDISVPADGTPQRVMEDANVIVDATRVFHGPEVPDAYAYRFTIKASGKTVVFSGDTAAPDANLIRLAQGCDVLVHEVQDNAGVDEIVASLPPAVAATVKEHLYNSHSSVLDVPGVAKASGAKALVFCHYGPIATVPPRDYLKLGREAARSVGYRGRMIAPTDLDVIAI